MKNTSSCLQLFRLNESNLASISKYYCIYTVVSIFISGSLEISRCFERQRIVYGWSMGEDFAMNRKCKKGCITLIGKVLGNEGPISQSGSTEYLCPFEMDYWLIIADQNTILYLQKLIATCKVRCLWQAFEADCTCLTVSNCPQNFLVSFTHILFIHDLSINLERRELKFYFR